MKKINPNELEEYSGVSPKGKFAGAGKDISEGLGWDPQGAEARQVEILRLAPGQHDSSEEMVVYVVADNPVGESAYYPDSRKWLVRSPERRLLRGEALDYFDTEE